MSITKQSALSDGAHSSLVRVIEAKRGLKRFDLHELSNYRELVYFLIWRDLKIRYKQTLIGASWAIVQPLVTMITFTLIFGYFAQVPSDGLPYPVFAYAALLPWSYFSGAVARSGNSLIDNANLISKIYFPRIAIPLASMITPMVDFLLAFVVLLGLMLWYRIVPGWGLLLLPGFMILALLTAFSVGLWLSALNVKYRDVKHAIPFLIQIWMYASPIVYPTSIIPPNLRPIYSLNPMVGVIEGFRWSLFGGQRPDLTALAVSMFIVLALLISGLIYFKQVERTFADVI